MFPCYMQCLGTILSEKGFMDTCGAHERHFSSTHSCWQFELESIYFLIPHPKCLSSCGHLHLGCCGWDSEIFPPTEIKICNSLLVNFYSNSHKSFRFLTLIGSFTLLQVPLEPFSFYVTFPSLLSLETL